MVCANIDNNPIELRNNLELDAAHLLPHDLVKNKHSNHNKRGSAEISDINSDDALVSTFGANPGIGDTGVHLCCYNLPGY